MPNVFYKNNNKMQNTIDKKSYLLSNGSDNFAKMYSWGIRSLANGAPFCFFTKSVT